MSNSTGLTSNFSASENNAPRARKNSKMDDLLLALWIMNPKDMDAPPGAILIDTPKGRSYLLPKKNAINLGLEYSAPLPASKPRLGCSKTCRYEYKIIIQCDYCPRWYHQYSWNPKPIKLPNGGRWMCPNHPQYLIDSVASLPALSVLERKPRTSASNAVILSKNVHLGRLLMTVGTAHGCEVRLNAALCRHVSSFHAAIYEDKATREYKLINHSEYGSTVTVDGVVFRLDAAQARGPTVEGEARAAMQVNQIVLLPTEHPCHCPPRRPRPPQGAAAMLIQHGCLLGFGCIMFEFYIES